MVANVALDSSAVSLLTAYNNAQSNLDKVQNAVSTGYDVSKASDNPLFFLESQSLRSQANAYNSYIPKLTQDKSALDRLQATIKTITDTASKLRDTITSLSSNPTGPEQQTAAVNITAYMNTIQNLINSSSDANGFSLGGGTVKIDVAPNKVVNLGVTGAATPSQSMTFVNSFLNIGFMLTKTSSTLPKPDQYDAGYIKIQNGTTYNVADLSTATNRANFLSDVSNFINNNLSQAAANAGAFSNALDSQLSSMQTNQNGLNAEADALTKTDLTADSAKSTALSTQEQLLTNLLSMSNQRMSTVLSLFR